MSDIKIRGTFRATPPTLDEGSDGDVAIDNKGRIRTVLDQTIAGEDLTNNVLVTEERATPVNISTQTTTTVKTGAGVVYGIVIPTPVATATVKIYDNTAASGTVILDTITFPATLVSDGPIPIKLNASFTTGLTVITGTATMSLTVLYR